MNRLEPGLFYIETTTWYCSLSAGPGKSIQWTFWAGCQNKRKQFIGVIINQTTKLVISIPSSKRIALHVAPMFFYLWISPYWTLVFLFINNGHLFVRKYLETICRFFGVKRFTAFAYHLQTSRQPEHNNELVVAHFCQYIVEHQRNFELVLQPLIYVCNTQVRCTTRRTLFRLMNSRQPHGQTKFVTPLALPPAFNSEAQRKVIRLRLLC